VQCTGCRRAAAPGGGFLGAGVEHAATGPGALRRDLGARGLADASSALADAAPGTMPPPSTRSNCRPRVRRGVGRVDGGDRTRGAACAGATGATERMNPGLLGRFDDRLTASTAAAATHWCRPPALGTSVHGAAVKVGGYGFRAGEGATSSSRPPMCAESGHGRGVAWRMGLDRHRISDHRGLAAARVRRVHDPAALAVWLPPMGMPGCSSGSTPAGWRLPDVPQLCGRGGWHSDDERSDVVDARFANSHQTSGSCRRSISTDDPLPGPGRW
jgi:hypothetical protein